MANVFVDQLLGALAFSHEDGDGNARDNLCVSYIWGYARSFGYASLYSAHSLTVGIAFVWRSVFNLDKLYAVEEV